MYTTISVKCIVLPPVSPSPQDSVMHTCSMSRPALGPTQPPSSFPLGKVAGTWS